MKNYINLLLFLMPLFSFSNQYSMGDSLKLFSSRVYACSCEKNKTIDTFYVSTINLPEEGNIVKIITHFRHITDSSYFILSPNTIYVYGNNTKYIAFDFTKDLKKKKQQRTINYNNFLGNFVSFSKQEHGNYIYNIDGVYDHKSHFPMIVFSFKKEINYFDYFDGRDIYHCK